MPNLKDIRRRIRSVKSTQKITQAMRMVAAAKVKRAENRVKAARPYSWALQDVFTDVYNALKDHVKSLEGSRYIELLYPRKVKTVGIVVISSDRGLCGAYNSAIIRKGLQLEKALVEKGITPKFYLVGSKAITAFKRYSKAESLGKISNMTAAPSIQDADTIAETLVKAFTSGEIDSIEVLSTHFKSMVSFNIEMTPLIPVKGQIKEYTQEILPEASHVSEDITAHEDAPKIRPELQLEPDASQTLDQLVPMYLSNSLYILLLEAAASELASRMTAMTNATNNASDMIDRLSIQYNKARQASITQEILEVVGGAEAIQ
ncbi:MAG: ATP synthase F1 subunit gamma [Vampirovibrio sp.]|nr:ATP synthase F1 subunit gamma [Vampirovibrio sp.]